jgi:hypothetical protein
MIKFHAFRYFLVPFGDQLSLNHVLYEKNQLIYNIFKSLQNDKKIDTIYWNKRYVLYITETLAEGLYVCKFAREINITIDKEGSTDIESIPESSFPYIYIIVDLHRQIILIQNKHSVFNRIETPKNAFASMFNTLIEQFDYEFSLDTITSQNEFWQYYKNNEGIFEFELRMKSPNLFGGIVDAESLLKQINEDYNNTETTLKVKNSQGKLKIARVKIQSFIKYVSGGGGEWVLKILTPRRVVRRISSRQLTRTVEFKSSDQITNREIVIREITNIDEVIQDISYPTDDYGDNKKS